MNTFNTQKTENTTNVWLTPRHVLDLLGHFDVDPCAAIDRPWDCADVNYTEEDNGLVLPWRWRVWLNPPYGNEAEAFMDRMSIHTGGGLALIFMRPISVRESLRIMGFPEDYKLVGTQTEQRKFIGNAVEVNMARVMAQALSDSIPGAVEIHGQQMSFEFRKEVV